MTGDSLDTVQGIGEPMRRLFLAELIGTALLLISVVDSGIMSETLANENLAIALLANAIATGYWLLAACFIASSVFLDRFLAHILIPLLP